jgi:hypothetical protein
MIAPTINISQTDNPNGRRRLLPSCIAPLCAQNLAIAIDTPFRRK